MKLHELCVFLPTLALSLFSSATQAWPNTPLTTSGRWIIDRQGDRFTPVGVNWPGAADTMLPEGLQYASIESTMSKIKSLGMNVIRLTFAIEMVDEIYEAGHDITIEDALITALGTSNGTILLQGVLANNPSFNANTTRIQVFDAVASEAAAQGIYVHLDNHVSKAIWCCSETDGNAWFGDIYFNITNWKRGLVYMVNHASSNWPNFASIGMRNELRDPVNSTVEATYNWSTWYTNMVDAATQIYNTSTVPLTFFSGLDYDTDLSSPISGTPIGPSNQSFIVNDFPFANKLVFELHNYENSATNCSSITNDLYQGGYDTLDLSDQNITNHAPMVMTEFGFSQDNSTYLGVYATCLRQYLPSVHSGWMTWVIAGSYYIREGVEDMDESWGLLTHDWSTWRSPAAVQALKGMVDATLAS